MPGLANVSYPTPLIVTLLTSAGLLVVFLALGLITSASAYSLIQRALSGEEGASPILGGVCGLVSLVSLASVGFLGMVIIRAVRDLRTPIQYARGDVMDKRSIGGRNVGNWMAVGVRYIGPDLEEASALTDVQRAAAPDRSQVVQPRFEPPTPAPAKTAQTAGSYLPSGRIYSSQQEPASPKPGAPSPEDDFTRVVFRVDPSSFGVVEPGDEVIVAHSRYLQHIYYVAHLRGGDWESYRNKQLL